MVSNKATANKLYFENLDGLRFFCFLSVFLFHSFKTGIPDEKSPAIFHFFKITLFGNGFLGVNFFFVLSGFLITYLLIKEKIKNKNIQIVNFWIRRILRIWPLYFACVFYGFVIFPYTKVISGGVPNETANPWYYIGFISNFDNIKQDHYPDALGLLVLWSVAVEEQFYLVWPVILSFFPVKKFWIPLFIILISSLIFKALNDLPILHEMHTLSCIGDMALGGLGAWLIVESVSFKIKIQNLPKWLIISFYLGFVFVFLFRDEFLLSTHFIRTFERLIISSIMLFIILEQCFSKHSFYKMSNFSIPTRLGVITYGLYCLHFIIISATLELTKLFGLNTLTWHKLILEPALALLITIILGILSYKFLESPFLRWKDKFAFKEKNNSI